MHRRLAAGCRLGAGAAASVPTWTPPSTPAPAGTSPPRAPCRGRRTLEPLVTRVLAPNPSADDAGRHQHLPGRRPGQRPGGAGRPRPGRRRAPGGGGGGAGRPRTPACVGRPGHPPPRRPRRGRAAVGRPASVRRSRRHRRGRGGPAGRVLAPGDQPAPRRHDHRRRRHPRPHAPTTSPSGWSPAPSWSATTCSAAGTSVVTHPEGDVVAYLESLRRVHDLGPSALYCGHGPELTEDPGAVLDFYLPTAPTGRTSC